MRITNKMLTILLVILLVTFKITSAETSDDKFIDSLPEDQKREFLEKVEERIKNEVPEVKSPAGNDTDVDFYEQQLENQGKSIQNILRTEIDILKRRSINDTSGNRRSNRNEEDDSHIDLTVRSRKDKRRAELESIGKPIKTVLVGNEHQESEVIPVAIQYDSKSIYPEKVSAEVKKTNEITWIKPTSTKSLDISNDSANTSETVRRINYIDTPLHTLDNVAQRNTHFNESADADGTTRDKIIAPTYHEHGHTSSFTTTTSKEAIQSTVKLNDDISATETISTAELNSTSQTIRNEEDETKGKVFVTTDDINGSATQSYTVAQQSNADSTTLNYSYLQTNYESSSSTFNDVTTSSDVFIESTVKYESDAYLINELRNETEEYLNSLNIGVSTTPYEVDISANLDDVNANKHVTNNNKPVISKNTAAYDVNAVSNEISTNKIFVESFTLENNITLANVSDSASIHNSASQITNNPMAGTADNSIKRIVDLKSHTVIAFKSNGVTTDAENVNPDHGFIATTNAFSKNEPQNIDHNPVLQNLLGSSLQSNPSLGDKGDIVKDNMFSVTTNNIIGSTLIDETNAFVDDTENHINSLTNSPSGSTKLGDVNALSDTNNGSVTVNIISEKTTDNVVGVTKLGNVNADTAANYLNTATDGPSGSTVLGDVSAEKYDENQRTTTDKVQATTESLAVSTKLGNVNIEKDIIIDFTGPLPHEASLKGEKTSYKLPDHLKVVVNIVHHNQTKNKTKLNNDDETNNTALLKSVSKDTNGKDLGDFSKHLTMRMKEDQNLYRVYEVGQKKETNSPTHNEKDENDTHYVRVYNYDPENAYFNADDQRNPGGKNDGEKILRENPVIIKEIEARSKSTSIDVNFSSQFNTSKPSLKIKDVKDMDTPVTNNYVDVAVDEVILGDLSKLLNGRVKTVEKNISDDDTAFEKPLKRGLNKIRQMLFNADHKGDENKSSDRVGDQHTNQREVDTEYKNDDNVMKPYNENHEGLTKDIENILTQLKNLVDRVDDTKTSVSKTDSVGNIHDSVDDIYKDIINSLKTSQNPDIQLMVETLQNVEENEENKYNAKSADKPRFKIKDRDGKHLKKDLSSKQEDYIPHIIPEDIYVKANEFEESKPQPIILEDKYLELHVNTLKDLVDKDDEGLEGYDWLGTTVLIQAGIEKLQHIVDTKLHHKRLHPLDHQLLEFIIDLHLTAEEVNEDHKEDIESQRRLSFPKPKGKKGKKHNKKAKTLHKIFNDLKKGKTRKRSGHDVNDLEEFLDCLEQGLNDLHTAIKQISLVTKYESQHWFRDIKQLYLKSAGTKEYLELLLHITTARLISLLDESAKKLVAEDEDFIKKNRASIERIGVEFIMVLKICKELEAIN